MNRSLLSYPNELLLQAVEVRVRDVFAMLELAYDDARRNT